jgi:peptidylprolyl isomerase
MIQRRTTRTLTICALTGVALGLGACGNSSDDNTNLPAAVPANPPAETTATATMTAPASTTSNGKTKHGISTDLSRKPSIPKPSGKAPTKLVVKDIVKGTGKPAKSGDNVVVQYVGALYRTGAEFEASWDTGKPFPFVLGQGDVIPGWDRGLEGMRVGGRRLLIIPPNLAYGKQGSDTIGPNETLMFVVDRLKDTSR